MRCVVLVLVMLGCGPMALGQQEPPGSRASRIADRFDTNDDGVLDEQERADARAYIRLEREQGRGPGRVPRRGGGPAFPPAEGRPLTPKDVTTHRTGDLYDTAVLRTLFIDFEEDDWHEEMADFYRTDVEVPAQLVVDGRTYPGVGVAYRGNSSYFTLSAGQKRSLAISIDAETSGQRLYGYRTLNLLNIHADPSCLREVLFGHVARQVYPAYRSNWVRVVINGECWGLYVNAQQINRDALLEAWGTRGDARWKIPANMRSGGTGLTFNGYERGDYEGRYELKSGDPATAWPALIVMCSRLEQMVPGDAEWLDEILAVDDALRFIALENVLLDGDGYVSRRSDYALFMDEEGRFHPLPYDSNEAFRYPGGGPGFDAMDAPGATMDPLQYENDPDRPLISRLLADPALKARYLAHVRHLARDVLDPRKIDPMLEAYRALITEEVRLDSRKLYRYEQFVRGLDATLAPDQRGTPGIRTFLRERRAFILAHPAIDVPCPDIRGIERIGPAMPSAGDPVAITARIGGSVDAAAVILHYAIAPLAPFRTVAMERDAGAGRFTATIPPQPAGTTVRYYVEARAPAVMATAFDPPTAEYRAHTYRVAAGVTAPPVVINEFQASNVTTVADPQGEFDDWIELYNPTDRAVDLGGIYITDDVSVRAKFRFAPGTTIAPRGFLVVWADRDVDDAPGVHLRFRLAKSGGVIRLTDGDDRGNRLLDEVVYRRQATDRSLARTNDGTGGFVIAAPTPGRSNRSFRTMGESSPGESSP